jgi:hypothetical protein
MAVSHRLFKPKKRRVGRMATKNHYKIRFSLNQKKNSVGSGKEASSGASSDKSKLQPKTHDRGSSFLNAEKMRGKKPSFIFKGKFDALAKKISSSHLKIQKI